MRGERNRIRDRDRGQVTVFVIIMVAAFVMGLGLVFDGGGALRAKNRAMIVAQEAARVGAQQLDWAAYRAGGIQLDPVTAGQAAQGFLAESGATGTVSVNGDTVTVTASVTYGFVLLPLGATVVDGSASARPFSDPTP